MHRVLTIAQFVGCSWQWSYVIDALHLRIHVALALSTISIGIDVPVTHTPSEMTRVLVIGVELRLSGG